MEGIKAYDGSLAGREAIQEAAASRHNAGTVLDRPKQVNTVVTLLYVMSGLSLLDVLAGSPGGIVQIGLNLFLAHHIKQLKSWARTWMLIRASIGIVANFFVLGLHNANSGQLPVLVVVYLINLVFCIAMLTLLMKEEVKRAFQDQNN